MPNRGGQTVALIKGLQEMTEDLDLIICDLWGVMHNGISPFAAAVHAIESARNAGIQTVFLSNAPRPRTYVRSHLLEMGVPHSLTDYVVTSGGLARDEVRRSFVGKHLYHLGPETDRNTIADLPVTEVKTPAEADVIFATDLDFGRVEDHRGWLANAAQRKVPFLCANPDRVVHVGERLFQCAGAVADLYTTMGGEVRWFGKPTAYALKSCIKEVGLPESTPGNRILMIGDSLQTDMAGAYAAGYDGLFIAGGIHRAEYPKLLEKSVNGQVAVEEFQALFGAKKAVPHAVMNQLCW
ncbi:TIGR01459 family HAD-type hydrolase [Kordiimonas pumila]|uniref:TIGR01459 family HAD-type hydrolase n=1 Tax=Kordiimonas pumila TaxID=2161677 RepID=A0ABV7D704_9PROT|nr:TIGR01459 family HAD-type hydrolase [Kordiimonas pumila]